MNVSSLFDGMSCGQIALTVHPFPDVRKRVDGKGYRAYIRTFIHLIKNISYEKKLRDNKI